MRRKNCKRCCQAARNAVTSSESNSHRALQKEETEAQVVSIGLASNESFNEFRPRKRKWRILVNLEPTITVGGKTRC